MVYYSKNVAYAVLYIWASFVCSPCVSTVEYSYLWVLFWSSVHSSQYLHLTNARGSFYDLLFYSHWGLAPALKLNASQHRREFMIKSIHHMPRGCTLHEYCISLCLCLCCIRVLVCVFQFPLHASVFLYSIFCIAVQIYFMYLFAYLCASGLFAVLFPGKMTKLDATHSNSFTHSHLEAAQYSHCVIFWPLSSSTGAGGG